MTYFTRLLYLFMIFVTTLSAVDKNHFIIAIDPEYIPFTQRDIDGKATGLLVDFWDLWAKENQYTVEYKFYPWEETIEATKRGEVDFHSGTTKDREWMQASNPIYELATGLFVRDTFNVSSLRDLLDKRIGTIDEYYGELAHDALGGSAEIVLYDDYPNMVEALKNGKIDALIDDVEAIRYFFIKTGQMNLFKRVDVKGLKFVNEIYAITNPKNKTLLAQINKGLKNINLIDLVHIEEVWLPRIEDAYYNKKLSKTIAFTPKEEAWLKREGSMSITGDPSWTLNSSNEKEQNYKGVAGDYLTAFSKNMHIRTELNAIESWAELIATPADKSADVVMGTMNSDVKKVLEDKYNFLKAYKVAPLVIVMDKNIRFVTDLSDVKEKHIGVLALQNYTNRIEQHYDAYQFYSFGRIDLLLNALLKSRVNAVILPLPEAILALSNDKYETLDIIGKMNYDAYMNVGVLKTKRELNNIINKVILSIGYEEKKKILSRWTQKLNYIEKIDYQLLFVITLIFAFLLLSVLYYVYLIRKENQYEKKLSKELELLALKDDLTGLQNRRAFNQEFESLNFSSAHVGMLFIDVDYFKKYNDYYGHLRGDAILKEIADILKNFEEPQCSLYRIGGEEFGMLLHGLCHDKAKSLAQSICESIALAKIEHLKSPLGYLSVSIGVCRGVRDENKHMLYLYADQALYRAKALGKNQVFCKDAR